MSTEVETNGFIHKGSYVYAAETTALINGLPQQHSVQALTRVWECVWCGCAVTNTITHSHACAPRLAVGALREPPMPEQSSSELRLETDSQAGASTTEPGTVTDGWTVWSRCARVNCGLEVVRPGKVQCWCDEGGAR